MHKIYKDFKQESRIFHEGYNLYSHIKVRNALDLKVHTTFTQPLEYKKLQADLAHIFKEG